MATIEAGTAAPDFNLYDSDKRQVTLSEFRGSNVVLLFFPMAFSSVCTAELCSVRDSFQVYERLNAILLGISVDSLYTLARFREEQQLGFRLLSDFNKEVSTAYGALYETFAYGMRGVSKRAAFVIGKTGVIHYGEVLDNAGLQPDFSTLQETLNRLT